VNCECRRAPESEREPMEPGAGSAVRYHDRHRSSRGAVMYAVIKAGGKQQRVKPGDVIEVELVRGQHGDSVSFTPLLVVDDDGKTHVGKELGRAVVKGKLVGEEKGDKVKVFKYRSKTGYAKRQGHRQMYTLVEIEDVTFGRRVAQKKAEEAAPQAAPEEPPAAEEVGAVTEAQSAEEAGAAAPSDPTAEEVEVATESEPTGEDVGAVTEAAHAEEAPAEEAPAEEAPAEEAPAEEAPAEETAQAGEATEGQRSEPTPEATDSPRGEPSDDEERTGEPSES
jgi:large subunit ribosomal protein L21